jgi:hypothetical protein
MGTSGQRSHTQGNPTSPSLNTGKIKKKTIITRFFTLYSVYLYIMISHVLCVFYLSGLICKDIEKHSSWIKRFFLSHIYHPISVFCLLYSSDLKAAHATLLQVAFVNKQHKIDVLFVTLKSSCETLISHILTGARQRFPVQNTHARFFCLALLQRHLIVTSYISHYLHYTVK